MMQLLLISKRPVALSKSLIQYNHLFDKEVSVHTLQFNYILTLTALYVSHLGKINYANFNFHDSRSFYPEGFTSHRMYWSANQSASRTAFTCKV